VGASQLERSFAVRGRTVVAERWVGSSRRDLLDHVIILNERHLKRLMSSYVLYYHETGLILDSRRTRQQSAYGNPLCA